MTPVELTTIGLAIATVISSVIVPFLLRRRAARLAATDTNIVSWQSITAVLQKERDSLREQLDEVQAQSRARIRQLDEEYSAQLLIARRRITQLESDVQVLTDRLRHLGEPLPPLLS